MQLQRIQSVFLFLGAALMAMLCFVINVAASQPIDGSNVEEVFYMFQLSELIPLMIINLLVAVLMFIAIFLYTNLKLQMSVTRVSMVLIIVSGVLEAWDLHTMSIAGYNTTFFGSCIMLVASLILAALALNGMKKDKQLLSSADRLR